MTVTWVTSSIRAMRRTLPVVLATLACALLAAPAAAAAAPTKYVALGDSYASGPLIPAPKGSPLGCLRSDHNYASILARSLGAELTDVTCGGATTDSMTGPQTVLLGTNPPQFDALRADTDLVTVSISGNDIGFAGIVGTCGVLSLTNPGGSPCQARYGDQLADRIAATAPKVAAVLQGIHTRSPKARVVLVGYLRLLPPTRGCWPVVPISAGDVPYLDGVEQQLNAMLAAQAAANGATFVDPYPGSLGHDMCQPIGTKWVEGLLPTDLAAPVHPNAAGMRFVAGLVGSSVGGHAME